MNHLRRLAILLSFSLPLSIGGCASENLSSKGQLIECAVAADGTTSDCHAVEEPSGTPGTCVDHDNDGDDDPHDDDLDDAADDDASLTGDTDDDDDGTTDDEDDDDDNDGIADDDDCDELPGGDDDDTDD